MLNFCLSMIETEEEKDKFEELYNKYKGIVHYIALDYMSKEGLVEDAAQETFIKLIRYLDKIQNIDDHKTFSFVKIVTKSVCVDMLRKEKSNHIKDQKMLKNEIPAPDLTDFYVLEESISTLPEPYRDVLMLKYYYNLKEKEIAFIFNISKSGVYKRLNKAKALLKEEQS